MLLSMISKSLLGKPLSTIKYHRNLLTHMVSKKHYDDDGVLVCIDYFFNESIVIREKFKTIFGVEQYEQQNYQNVPLGYTRHYEYFDQNGQVTYTDYSPLYTYDLRLINGVLTSLEY